jgi:hypothetical protein
MTRTATEYLAEKVVVPVTALEVHLRETHYEEWERSEDADVLDQPMRDGDGKAKARKRWENLTDHVKRALTNQDLIRYAKIGESRYVVYWPCHGVVFDRPVIDRHYANRVMSLLTQSFD